MIVFHGSVPGEQTIIDPNEIAALAGGTHINLTMIYLKGGATLNVFARVDAVRRAMRSAAQMPDNDVQMHSPNDPNEKISNI